MMNKVKMYCTAFCPYCIRAEMLLKAKGVKEINKIFVDKVRAWQPGVPVLIFGHSMGGLISATLLTLLILPAIYMIWKGIPLRREIRRRHRRHCG